MEFESLRAKMPVHLTERARQQIRRLRTQVAPDFYLRLGVRRRLYSKLTYFLKFDEMQDYDYKLRIGDLDLIIHASHVVYATCLRIDFVGDSFKITSCNKKKIVEWGKIENIYYP